VSDRSDTVPARHASPFRINLDQQRKRAKDLLRALRDGDAEAQRRFRLHHPRAAQDDLLRLSEAQFVIARELGLPSWPKLKAHVEAMDRSWQRITQGEPAPDRDSATLHIRCGSDIGAALVEAGFTGDFPGILRPLLPGAGHRRAGDGSSSASIS
jgi:hypothetical protein